MARQIKSELKSEKNETRLSSAGLINNGLRAKFSRWMTLHSADSTIVTNVVTTEVEPRNVAARDVLLKRVRIL